MQIPVDLNDINKWGDGARAQRDILTSFVPPAHIASSCLENIAPSVILPHLHRRLSNLEKNQMRGYSRDMVVAKKAES